MLSLSSIVNYWNTLRPFWTPDHFGPSFWSNLLSFWSKFVWHFDPPSLSHCILVSGHLDPLTFPLSFFKESKALLASTIIFFEDTSCLLCDITVIQWYGVGRKNNLWVSEKTFYGCDRLTYLFLQYFLQRKKKKKSYETRNVSKVHGCPRLVPLVNSWPISNLAKFTNIFISTNHYRQK